MALTALIAAYRESDEPGGPLRAVLPLAGRTLIERQAKLAALAGARRILVLVERVPPELLAALDRLRREGLGVLLARSAEEAAGQVDPGDVLLLVADGFIGDESHLRRLAGASPPALLTVPDVRVDDRFERIDAESRWAGLALIDGALLAETASMLHDWDPQSTLLRRAVQAGARMLSVRGEAAEADLTIAERLGDLAAVHRRIVDRAASGRGDWISQYLLGPVERAATHALMGGTVTPAAIGAAAMALTALGAVAFVWHHLWIGLLLLLLATPLDGIADRLARLRLEEGVGHSWWSHLLPAFAAAALLALGLSLGRVHGWGSILLTVAILLFLLAQRLEIEGREPKGLIVLAERKGMSWLMLPFAVAGLWLAGLFALFGYAAASFFWAQRAVHAPEPPEPQD
ncbi:MAG: hypothetical protein QOI38_466 [Sphingomonadales bacterium]|nr:hypothetical protein [Sphingomonadales bacterium]